MRRTLPNIHNTVPFPGPLSKITPAAVPASRIRRVIFNIAQFCALSNPFPKFFRFFFGPGQNLHRLADSRFRFAFEENTGSQENRHHIKYTQFSILSSQIRKIPLKKSSKEPSPSALHVHLFSPYSSNYPLHMRAQRTRSINTNLRRSWRAVSSKFHEFEVNQAACEFKVSRI